MGQISKKLVRRFTRWAGRLQQEMRKAEDSIHIPKDVHDVETLLKDGYDPLHAVYISVQNITSLFAECISVLPELTRYYDVVAAAEDEYMPSGPPMSPLTRSYFTTWAFFDLRIGRGQETIGTCLLDVSDRLEMDPGLVEATQRFQESRMGIYEHCGIEATGCRLKELITGKEFLAQSTAGYKGSKGELWYVRLCPPIHNLVDYHVTITTPYILTEASMTDWTAYLKRSMLQLKPKSEAQGLYQLMKYGLEVNHWNEYVLQAYHHHQYDAIFLAGLPDVQGSLPHA